MAAPSHIVDGQAHWFEVGQLKSDPGIDRTPFGVPVNCAGGPIDLRPCYGTAARDTIWGLKSGGAIVGDLRWTNSAGWGVTDLHGMFAGNASCVAYDVDGKTYYSFSVVTNLLEGFPGQYLVNDPTQNLPDWSLHNITMPPGDYGFYITALI